MPGKFTPDGERFVGLSFLEGRSIGSIAQSICCSNRAVEAVLRAQMRHLIDAKKPDVKDAVPLTKEEAEAILEKVRNLTPANESGDTQPQSQA